VTTASNHLAGATNTDALREIEHILGGPPVVGALYRVGFLDAADDRELRCIAAYLGIAEDRNEDASGRILSVEPTMLFEVYEPALPEGANGTRSDPLRLWPLVIWHISPAWIDDLGAFTRASTHAATDRTSERGLVQ
jgi:hypothetical protein